MIEVKLSWAEAMMGAEVGLRRRMRRLANGAVDRYGFSGDPWQIAIEGTVAELAVAKLLGRYWGDSPDPDYDGDIGDGIQVRYTSAPHGRLILHKGDRDHHVFYLVRGVMPVYQVMGWISGERGKQPEFWTDPGTGRPAFFVPAEKLNAPRGGQPEAVASEA